jgi:hypothetical protein
VGNSVSVPHAARHGDGLGHIQFEHELEVARPFKSINFQKDEPIAQKHIIGWKRGTEARAIA